MLRRAIGYLLWRANAKPPDGWRVEFYLMKDRILSLYGRHVGDDIQHIVKECWTCYGSGDRPIDTLLPCPKCGGTGIFDQFWVYLQGYEIGGYRFHTPKARVHFKPTARTTVEGYIRHKERRGAFICQLILSSIFNHSLFLTLLRKMVPHRGQLLWIRLEPHRCYQCHRKFYPAWSKSCFFCAKCKRERTRRQTDVEGVPF